jgi:hypothetical protein
MKSKVVLWSAVADALCIVIFVAIGRENHDEGGAVSGVFRVAAPFLIAAVAGWLASQAWKKPLDLRRFVFDDGTAAAFIIVATVFLCAFLNGWRAIVRKRLNR